MRRVIMLLPNPDNLQLANCHKYVSRQGDKAYSDIYTTMTIVGKCADVDKILVIGHGFKGSFKGTTIGKVVEAIILSGIELTGNKKVAFDTCYGGSPDTNGASALQMVKNRLKKKEPKCNLELVGATGCSVTIGSPVGTLGKRLVINDSRINQVTDRQVKMTKDYNVDLFGNRNGWHEWVPSAKIKAWAHEEYSKLIWFALDFRSSLGQDLDTGPGRKVKLRVDQN
jgi:hypothetical protein